MILSMGRAKHYVLAALPVVATVIGFWWWTAKPRPPQPPVMRDPSSVDPLVGQLIEQTLAEVRRNPRHAEFRARLAMVYHANGLVDLAGVTYEQALALNAKNARWWYHLARIRAEVGDVEAAIATVGRTIALDDAYAPAHWRRGLWLLQLGRVDEAEFAFRQAAQVNPDDPGGWVGQARVLLSRGKYEQAVQLLRGRVVANWPDYGYARRLLGTGYRPLGQEAAARRELARSQGSSPVWKDAWVEEVKALATGFSAIMKRADVLIARGQLRQALALVTPLRKPQPTNPDLLNKIAEAHFGLGEPQRARDALMIAAQAHPKHFPTHLNLSLAYEQTRDMRLALRHANQAIAINPGSGSAYLQKARLYTIVENYESAVEPLEQAVRYGVLDSDVLLMLGNIQARLNRWQEAADTFEMVIKQRPDQASAFALLAWVKGEAGALGEARAALQHAAELDAQEPLLQPTAARLRQLEQAGPASVPNR